MPKVVRMYAMHVLSRLLCYWLPNYLLFFIHQKGLLRRWKIQIAKYPRSELIVETLRKNLLDDLVLQFFTNLIAHKFLCWGSRWQAKEDTTNDSGVQPDGLTEEAANANEKKWGPLLRFTGPAPRWWTHVWQVAVGYLGFDFMFYWSHRLMHHKRLYKHCHKIHHQYHSSVGVACAHEHPIESFVQLLAWWLPIAFAGFLNRRNGGLHISTLFYHHCFRWIETVDAHSGHEFPFSPFHAIPIFGGARRHDYHHRAFDGNYGSTIFWDWMCGTSKDFWEEVKENGGFMRGGQAVLR